MIKKKTMTYFGTEKTRERRKEERKLLRHSNQLKIIFIDEYSCYGLPVACTVWQCTVGCHSRTLLLTYGRGQNNDTV